MKQTLLTTMLLLCALMAGGSSAWAIEVTATLTGEAMLEGSNPSDSYAAHNIGVTDDKGNVYKGYWVYQKNGKAYMNMIQIKQHASEKSAHIVLPKFDGYIKTITLTTTNANSTTSSGTGAKNIIRIVKGNQHTSTEGNNENNKILDAGSTSSASKSYVFDFTELGTKYDGEGLYIATPTKGSVRIWKIEVVYEVTTTPAKITAAEYATFNSKYATDFSTTGITAYTAVDNGLSVGLNEVTSGKVPANTPVVLYKAGADGTAIDVPVIASAAVIEQKNDLHVSDGSDQDGIYVLAKPDDKEVGFYKWAGAALSAGKVYLKSTAAARDFLGFDETTAVESVKVAAAQQGDYYNLAGQRVANPTKGLYIVNGKKVIIK